SSVTISLKNALLILHFILCIIIFFFFFQAEDGIRDFHVTGVQTCALPIYRCTDSTDRSHGQRPVPPAPASLAGSPPDAPRQARTSGPAPRWCPVLAALSPCQSPGPAAAARPLW